MNIREPVAALSNWGLDPATVFLNNGSFGAPPLVISQLRTELLQEIERNPVKALATDYPIGLERATLRLSNFVGAEAEGFAFVPNATFGINAVLGSFPFTPGGEVVVFPHRYPAVGNAAHFFAERAGAKVVETEAPERLTSSSQLVKAFEEAITPRTQLVIIDHIASLSGILFPVQEIVALCRSKQVPVLVDGAHAPGQVPVDIRSLQPDFYTGNFHKWLYAPRPSGFLYVAPGWRSRIRPPIVSNFHGKGFRETFAWCGTFDPTPLLCTESALEFYEKLGGQELSRRNHELAAYGGTLLLKALGTEGAYAPDSELFAAMFACVLPDGMVPADEIQNPGLLRARFLKKTGIEAHFSALGDRVWIRLCAQAFNTAADMEKLAASLPL